MPKSFLFSVDVGYIRKRCVKSHSMLASEELAIEVEIYYFGGSSMDKSLSFSNICSEKMLQLLFKGLTKRKRGSLKDNVCLCQTVEIARKVDCIFGFS